jgi:AraC-like DNA-binding protein
MTTAIRVFEGPYGRALLLNVTQRMAAHAHHHCHVLVKAAGPDVTFIIRDQPYVLSNDNALVMNVWETHSYIHQVVNKHESTVILALHVEPEWLSQADNKFRHIASPRFFQSPSVLLTADLRRAAEDTIAELWWADSVTVRRIESVVTDFIVRVAYAALGSSVERQRHNNPLPLIDKRIRKAIALIKESKLVEISVDALAKECSLSRAHFFTLFRDQTTVTPTVYANTLKMEEAFRRLSESAESISRISVDLGFSAPGHFTRFFSLHQGITPSEYKKKVQVLPDNASFIEEQSVLGAAPISIGHRAFRNA